MAAHIRVVINDNLGNSFSPDELPHTYVRDGNGNILTDTCVEASSITRVKTYGGWTQYGDQWFPETVSGWINITQTNVD